MGWRGAASDWHEGTHRPVSARLQMHGCELAAGCGSGTGGELGRAGAVDYLIPTKISCAHLRAGPVAETSSCRSQVCRDPVSLGSSSVPLSCTLVKPSSLINVVLFALQNFSDKPKQRRQRCKDPSKLDINSLTGEERVPVVHKGTGRRVSEGLCCALPWSLAMRGRPRARRGGDLIRRSLWMGRKSGTRHCSTPSCETCVPEGTQTFRISDFLCGVREVRMFALARAHRPRMAKGFSLGL